MSPIPNREAPEPHVTLHSLDGWDGLIRHIREERKLDTTKVTYHEAMQLLFNVDLSTERVLGLERAAEVAL